MVTASRRIGQPLLTEAAAEHRSARADTVTFAAARIGRLVHRRRARRVGRAADRRARRRRSSSRPSGTWPTPGLLQSQTPVGNVAQSRRLLVEVERHAAVGGIAEVQWLELALEDVFGERATLHLPRRPWNVTGHAGVPSSDIVQRLGRTGIGQAHVGAPAGLLARTFCSIGRSLGSFSMFVSHWSRVEKRPAA